jgi:hypothetical protein
LHYRTKSGKMRKIRERRSRLPAPVLLGSDWSRCEPTLL